MYLYAKTLTWTAPSFLLSTENLFLSNGLSFFFFNLATERQYKMQKKVTLDFKHSNYQTKTGVCLIQYQIAPYISGKRTKETEKTFLSFLIL